MRLARYVRLYSDAQGETHFEDLEVPLEPREFTHSHNVLSFAEFLPVTSSFLVSAPGDWEGQSLQQAAERQILCTVEGEYEVTASDGEVRCFPAGSMLLIEDTTGKGHQMRITYKRGVLILALAIADVDAAGRVV